MAVQYEDLIAAFVPAYAGDAAISVFAETITPMLDPTCLPGNRYQTALAYGVLHLLTLRDRVTAAGGSASMAMGGVMSEKTGDLAVSYGGTASASADDPWAAWMTTAWGQQFAALLKASPCAFPRFYA